jgi:hypothetical protein
MIARFIGRLILAWWRYRYHVHTRRMPDNLKQHTSST